jgi:hypothetical protein
VRSTIDNHFKDSLRRDVPPFKITDHDEDPVVWVKLKATWAPFEWHIIDFDGEDRCYGVVDWFGRRLIRFSLRRVLSLRGPNGETIIRDYRFAPCRVSDLE